MTHINEGQRQHPVLEAATQILNAHPAHGTVLSQGLQAVALSAAEDKLTRIVNELSNYEKLTKGLSMTIPDRRDGHPVEITYNTLVNMRDAALASLNSVHIMLDKIEKTDPLYTIYEELNGWIQLYITTLSGQNAVEDAGEDFNRIADNMKKTLNKVIHNANPQWVRTMYKELDARKVEGRTEEWDDLDSAEQQRLITLKNQRKEPILDALYLCNNFIEGYRKLTPIAQMGQREELKNAYQEMQKIALKAANVNGLRDHAKDLKERNFYTVTTPVIDLSDLAKAIEDGKGSMGLGMGYIDKKKIEGRIASILRDAQEEGKTVALYAPDEAELFAEALGVKKPTEAKTASPTAAIEAKKTATIGKQKLSITQRLAAAFGLGVRVNQDTDIKF